jgi:hypothetical protein
MEAVNYSDVKSLLLGSAPVVPRLETQEACKRLLLKQRPIEVRNDYYNSNEGLSLDPFVHPTEVQGVAVAPSLLKV